MPLYENGVLNSISTHPSPENVMLRVLRTVVNPVRYVLLLNWLLLVCPIEIVHLRVNELPTSPYESDMKNDILYIIAPQVAL